MSDTNPQSSNIPKPDFRNNPPQGDTTINSEHIAAKYVNRQQWAGSTNRIRIELASDIDRLIAQEAKAFGGCRICYGKGYATVRKGTTAKGKTRDLRTHINYCSCDRGKQLQQVVAREANKARISELKDIAAHAYSTDHVWGFLGTRLAQLTSEKESSNEL